MNFFADALLRMKLGNPTVLDYLLVRSAKQKLICSNDPIAYIAGVLM